MNLRAFLQDLESKSPEEIWRIPGEIEPGHDTTALVLELERRGEHPVLWFEKVRGSRFPVVTNVFGHRRRYARALTSPTASWWPRTRTRGCATRASTAWSCADATEWARACTVVGISGTTSDAPRSGVRRSRWQW